MRTDDQKTENYKTPDFELVRLECQDVICSSGLSGLEEGGGDSALYPYGQQ